MGTPPNENRLDFDGRENITSVKIHPQKQQRLKGKTSRGNFSCINLLKRVHVEKL